MKKGSGLARIGGHLVLAFALTLGGCTRPEGAPPAGAPGRPAAPAAGPEAEPAIREVLDRQARAWNAGDVAGYMDGYARTDSLRFASGGVVLRGWEPTLARYRQAYPDTAAMGQLTFSEVDVRVLSPSWAVVVGRWALRRSADFTDASGLFTLLFEKRPEGWRIVQDHTSSAEAASTPGE